MSAPHSQPGFLRDLTTLPLIGGGVKLVGNPTAVALTPTQQLLESYSAWLEFERRYLNATIFPRLPNGRISRIVLTENAGANFHSRDLVAADRGANAEWWQPIGQAAQERAALVLSVVGCDWRKDI